ncbi:lysozyme c-1 [Hyalella azteca]|uniref:lysozyme n=1 Tax=Hyalella azteca TaxID=294128 RepID=A0A8B7NT69_HYAAZ|nr:lysozyme c-1 [Hyalella azteca]
MRFLAAILLAVVSLSPPSSGKVYSQCELAKELKCVYGFAESSLADWVCLVQHASAYNTTALTVNGGRPRSRNYGLFQITDYYWCESAIGTNECNIACSRLADDDIADDVACAKEIFRRQQFRAWSGWRSYCENKNLSSYTRGCNLTC